MSDRSRGGTLSVPEDGSMEEVGSCGDHRGDVVRYGGCTPNGVLLHEGGHGAQCSQIMRVSELCLDGDVHVGGCSVLCLSVSLSLTVFEVAFDFHRDKSSSF